MSEPGTGVAYAVGPTARPPVAPLARAAQDSLARANRALLIVGCLVVLSISHGVDADLWGHVRYGQDVLAAHALPVTASHTYTAVGHPWINHENLGELAFGWIETHLGAAGLNAFNTLLGFLAGLAVLALYLGCRALGALQRRGRSGLKEVGAYGLVLAACGLATLANPYGPRLLTWLITDLVPPRPEIGEWHRLALPDPLFVVTAALVALTVAAFIGSGRPRDLRQVVLPAVTPWHSFPPAR